ncbi:hypothetical protein ACLOJK_007381 [Asimina triloba]
MSNNKANKNKKFTSRKKALANWDVIEEALVEGVKTKEDKSEYEALLGIHNNNIGFMAIHDDKNPLISDLREMLDELYADYKVLKAKYVEQKLELTNVKIESSRHTTGLKEKLSKSTSELKHFKAENVALKKTLTSTLSAMKPKKKGEPSNSADRSNNWANRSKSARLNAHKRALPASSVGIRKGIRPKEMMIRVPNMQKKEKKIGLAEAPAETGSAETPTKDEQQHEVSNESNSDLPRD